MDKYQIQILLLHIFTSFDILFAYTFYIQLCFIKGDNLDLASPMYNFCNPLKLGFLSETAATVNCTTKPTRKTFRGSLDLFKASEGLS